MSSDVLIVEDTGSIAVVYADWLTKADLPADHVEDGASALKALRSKPYKVVLLDLQLPDMNGMEVLKAVQEEQIGASVVVVTASGSINTAVEAMRGGAYDFIVKPAARERLVTTARNALERQSLQSQVAEIKSSLGKGDTHGFIGSSLPMIAVYKTIEAVARSDASVFISGESGTGKEVCAQAVHDAGPRRAGPFVALNCAAIPKDLMESEIFGHVKGAFTGATSDRNGAALEADGGTLFLDELCEMDLALQAKLLRFLQTGTVQKVGSDRATKTNVRIVCATNRDPRTEVQEGRFREDLYYRLHVVPIHLPPLRERDRDVIEIAAHLLQTINEEEGRTFKALAPEAEAKLLAHNWPGNVRELQNVIRNAVILNDGELLDADMLALGNLTTALPVTPAPADPAVDAHPEGGSLVIPAGASFDEIERLVIEASIDRCDGSIPRAAEALGLSPSTIYRKKEHWN